MPKPNAFMAFALELKQKYGSKVTTAEAVKYAEPIWNEMSKDERQAYVLKSKAMKPEPNKPKKAASTCVSTSSEIELKTENEQKCQEQLEMEIIQHTIKTAHNFKNQKFYFIFINFFIPEKAVPAEIALIEFSLKDGISREKHWHVNPQADFYGMLATCVEHVATTHQLPLPPNTLAKTEPHEIYFEILEFLNIDAKHSSSIAEYPPLYTYNTYIQAVRIALTSLIPNTKFVKTNLKIYAVQKLFYLLKCAISEKKGAKPKNHYVTNIIFERDSFEFEEGIACQYHQEIDRTRYCALSKVKRWAYTFADYMLNDLDLQFIPGKHCPQHIPDISNVQAVCEHASKLSLDKSVTGSTRQKSCESNLMLTPLRNSFRGKSVFSVPQSNSTRLDSTVPSVSHHFEKEPILRFYRGRGFALFNEHTVPKFNGMGRGRLLGRGIAILHESSFPNLGGIECDNQTNDTQF